jgi:hypothetical protein
MSEAASGRFSQPLSQSMQPLRFRKNDYFQELATEFNNMANKIQTVAEKNKAEINKAISILETAKTKAPPEFGDQLNDALKALLETQKS